MESRREAASGFSVPGVSPRFTCGVGWRGGARGIWKPRIECESREAASGGRVWGWR